MRQNSALERCYDSGGRDYCHTNNSRTTKSPINGHSGVGVPFVSLTTASPHPPPHPNTPEAKKKQENKIKRHFEYSSLFAVLLSYPYTHTEKEKKNNDDLQLQPDPTHAQACSVAAIQEVHTQLRFHWCAHLPAAQPERRLVDLIREGALFNHSEIATLLLC